MTDRLRFLFLLTTSTGTKPRALGSATTEQFVVEFSTTSSEWCKALVETNSSLRQDGP